MLLVSVQGLRIILTVAEGVHTLVGGSPCQADGEATDVVFGFDSHALRPQSGGNMRIGKNAKDGRVQCRLQITAPKKVERAKSPPGAEPELKADSASKKPEVRRDVVTRWGRHDSLMRDGFTPVVNTFLRYTGKLKPYGLTPTEALFVLHLMSYKWDDNHPYPGYKGIAEAMGVSVMYVRRLAKRLETKQLLRRRQRIGSTNEFDLQPLFDVLAAHVAKESRSPDEAGNA